MRAIFAGMLAVFVLYMVATVSIAWWYSRGTRTHREFVLGGGRFGGTALALSERATGESAWLLLGLTGHAYADGLSTVWVALGCVLGILFIWTVMAGRLRQETEETGAMTVSSLLARRFPGSEKPIALLSSVILIFFFLLYIAAQFSGSGKVLQGTFGLDPFWGIVIASIVVTIYCGLGGFIAVVVTDVFQALLMIFTLVAFPIIALFIAASHDLLIAGALQEAGPNYLSLTRGMTGCPGRDPRPERPQLGARLHRPAAAPDPDDGDPEQGRGPAGRPGRDRLDPPRLRGGDPDRPVRRGVREERAPRGAEPRRSRPTPRRSSRRWWSPSSTPILAGVLLSGVISAMMSTASSEVTVSSPRSPKTSSRTSQEEAATPKGMLYLNQAVTLAVGAVAIVLALTMRDTVYSLVSYAWSGIGSSFGPALILLLFWKKLSRAGVYASLVTGTVATVVWKTLLEQPTGVSERLASYVIALAMAVLFSMLFPERTKACL